MSLIENKIVAGFGSLAMKYKTEVNNIFLNVQIREGKPEIMVLDAPSFKAGLTPTALGTENFDDVISFNSFEKMLGAREKSHARIVEILTGFSQRQAADLFDCSALMRLNKDGSPQIRLMVRMTPKEELLMSNL